MESREEVLTEFDPMVINSHCHFDHVGGNYQFNKVYMGERDFPLLDVGLSHVPVLEKTQGISLFHLRDSFADKKRGAACINLVGKTRSREYIFPSIPSLRGRLYVLELMDEDTRELIGIFTKESEQAYER